MTTVDEIRGRIRATRKQKQMTAAQVAEAMGISRPFYTQLEGGTRRLGTEYLLRIAEAMRVPVTELMGEDVYPSRRQAKSVPRAALVRRLEPIVGKKADRVVEVVMEFLD